MKMIFYCRPCMALLFLAGMNCLRAADAPDSIVAALQSHEWEAGQAEQVIKYLDQNAANAGTLAAKLGGENSELRSGIASLPLEKRLTALSSILESCRQGRIGKNEAFSYLDPYPNEAFSYSEGGWVLACYYSEPGINKLYRDALLVFGDQERLVSKIEEILSGKIRQSMLKGCFWFPEEYKSMPALPGGKGYWDFIPAARAWPEKDQRRIVQEYWKTVKSVYDVMIDLHFKKLSTEQGLEILRKRLENLRAGFAGLQDLRAPANREERERLVNLFRDEMVTAIVPMIWTVKKYKIKSAEWGKEVEALMKGFERYQIPDCYLYENMVNRENWDEGMESKADELVKQLEERSKDNK